jgi:hypothetical protein
MRPSISPQWHKYRQFKYQANKETIDALRKAILPHDATVDGVAGVELRLLPS